MGRLDLNGLAGKGPGRRRGCRWYIMYIVCRIGARISTRDTAAPGSECCKVYNKQDYRKDTARHGIISSNSPFVARMD